jgi:hypothetical protein
VRAFTEAGIWKADDEAHNDGLVKRQAVLTAAWADLLKTNPPADKTAFREAWMTARKAALVKAGLDPIF